MRDTLQYNLGFRPDYYVRTNFDGLIGIVDTLGGIDVPVHCRLEDYWPYPDENGEYHMIALEPGVHHLDGEMALWYSRSRKTTSVFSRERRQQQVLQAIWRQARQQNLLPRLPELWSVAQGMVQTDMDFSTVASLAAVAFQLQEPAVRFRSISYAEVTPWTTPLGGNVFLPNWEKIQPVLDEALGPVPTSRLPNIAPRIEVWNGSHYPDYDRLAADRLYRAGFAAAVGTADHSNYERSQIVVFGDTTKGLGLAWLQNKFNVSVDRVIYAPDPNAPYPVRLIVGADYQPCDPNF